LWWRFEIWSPGALISGTSTGIGRATALALLSKGFNVIAGVRSQASAERLRQESAAKGSGHLETTLLDVTDPASIESAIAYTDKLTGPDGLRVLITANDLRLSAIRPAIAPTRLSSIVNKNKRLHCQAQLCIGGPKQILISTMIQDELRQKGHHQNTETDQTNSRLSTQPNFTFLSVH
jgi:hypothetical protein